MIRFFSCRQCNQKFSVVETCDGITKICPFCASKKLVFLRSTGYNALKKKQVGDQ